MGMTVNVKLTGGLVGVVPLLPASALAWLGACLGDCCTKALEFVHVPRNSGQPSRDGAACAGTCLGPIGGLPILLRGQDNKWVGLMDLVVGALSPPPSLRGSSRAGYEGHRRPSPFPSQKVPQDGKLNCT